MTIPKNKQFEELIGSFTLKEMPNQVNWDNILIAGPSTVISSGGEAVSVKPLNLFFKKNVILTFKAYKEKIRNEFTNAGHPVTEKLLEVVSAFLAYSNDAGHDSFSVIELLVRNIKTVDVSHFFITSYEKNPQNYFNWRGFKCGAIDLEKLQYRCSRALSDYFVRYEKELQNSLGIETPIELRTAINFKPYLKLVCQGANIDVINLLLDVYFELLSSVYINQTLQALEESQFLWSVHELDLIDVDSIRNSPLYKAISIYKSPTDDCWGYVSSTQTMIIFNWPSEDAPIVKAARKLEQEYGLGEFENIEIHQTIKAFARYAYMAKKAANEIRLGESFMNYMIALEIVFSERESTTSAISFRTAILTHSKFRKNINEMKKEVEDLYDTRSRFIHAGAPPDYKSLSRLREIVFEVYCCLLRLQMKRESRASGFLKKWLKKIDLIKATWEAGQNIDENMFLEVGIGM